MFVYIQLRIYIILIFLIASGNCAFGQQAENYATFQSHDTAAISKTIWQAVKLQYTDLDSADRILKRTYTASREAGFKEGMFYSMYALGFGEQWRGNIRKGIAYYQNALRYVTPRQHLVAPLYNNLGCAYLSIGKKRAALENFNKSLANTKGAKASTDSSLTYVNISRIWAELEEHEQAMTNMKTATDIAKRAGDSQHLCQVYLTTAQLCTYNSKWEKAIGYLAEAQRYSNAAAYSTRISIYDTWALALIEQKKYAEAFTALKNAKTIADTCGDIVPTFYTRALTGSLYRKTNDIANARKWLLPLYKKIETAENEQMMQSIRREVAELYHSSGEDNAAYKVLSAYTTYNDSLNKVEKSLLMEEWIEMKAEEKNQLVLQQELEIAIREQKIRKKYLWAGASVLGFLLLLSVSIGTVKSQKNKLAMRQSEVDYLRQSGEINELKARMRGEENERQRIATDLHNNIAGQIWAARMKVEHVQRTGERSELANVYKQINDAAEDITRTAENLLSQLLRTQNLTELLHAFCAKIHENTPFTVLFHSPGAVNLADKDLQYDVYGMVQELVQNAIKHAYKADTISVTLQQDNNNLTITVSDNGRQVNEINSGTGLTAIKKRLGAINGAFHIAQSQNGTTATIISPM